MTATVPNKTQLPPDADLEYEDWDEETTSNENREEWDQKVLQIEALIRRLSLAELNTIAEAVINLVKQKPNMGIPATMLLSEEVLARDWNSPEDDAAWGSLTGATLLTSLFHSATLANSRCVPHWCWQPCLVMMLLSA
jgi:hypothetical protein